MIIPVGSSHLLSNFLAAAERSQKFHEAEAERLRDSPSWQERWRAEEKARAAARMKMAIQDVIAIDAITSEGNK